MKYIEKKDNVNELFDSVAWVGDRQFLSIVQCLLRESPFPLSYRFSWIRKKSIALSLMQIKLTIATNWVTCIFIYIFLIQELQSVTSITFDTLQC
jgi:hypothetical protein